MLSLVIPAYNEGHRIAATLSEAIAFLESNFPTGEIVLVDDGSSDETLSISQSLAQCNPLLRVIAATHGGKAAAVRTGMTAARSDLIAFSDADLATPLHHLHDLVAAIERGCAVAIGSREGAGAVRVGEPFYRHVMGRGFNWLVRAFVLPGFSDTQCGFKLFRRDAVEVILSRTVLYAPNAENVAGPRVTAFDVEFLVIAKRQSLPVCVTPVTWTYGEQTKVDPMRDTWHNFIDILKIRLNDIRGLYR